MASDRTAETAGELDAMMLAAPAEPHWSAAAMTVLITATAVLFVSFVAVVTELL